MATRGKMRYTLSFAGTYGSLWCIMVNDGRDGTSTVQDTRGGELVYSVNGKRVKLPFKVLFKK